MTKTILTASMLAALTLLLIPQAVMASQQNNSDVSIWDSDVVPDLVNGIFPVGGSGQIAGNFAVDKSIKKDNTIQTGLRAQERFVGPIEPYGNVYLATPGESSPGRATWNFDMSIDMGTKYLETQLDKELTALNLNDFTVILEISDNEGNQYELDFANIPYPSETVTLTQISWNVGFGFIPIPIDSDVYDIKLSVSDDKKILAESEIKVVVTDVVPVDGEIDICHKGKKTITVGVDSIPAHLKHGDTIGSC